MIRLLVILFALLVAGGAGLVALPFYALVTPFLSDAAEAAGDPAAALFASLMSLLFESDDPVRGLARAVYAAGLIAAAVIFAPLVAVALIGEIARTRTLLWYAGATGLLSGAAPWIARATRKMATAMTASPAETRIALILFLTGATAGLIYWFIAGRNTGGRRTAHPDVPKKW